ncbi:hypothetical protein C8J57DRAFT_1516717 [Mycena rebaudengoi]|nr:hypothetical protein C8J57DRAFT_1516717 [Mycena rebaudengoi]
MIKHIHEILCAIVKLYVTSEINGALPIALLYDIAKFTETLQKIFTFMKGQQRSGKIKRLLRQSDTATKLETCKKELNHALEMFQIQVISSTHSQMVQMEKDAKLQHEELVTLLAAQPDLTTSDHSSVTGTLSTYAESSGSFSLLPPSPQIFHGREFELEHVVNILIQDSARITILGTGGIGKTSLAIAALHDAVAEHIGVMKGSHLSKKIAQYFMHAPPCLLILDNLETAWESLSSRPQVEEFLSLLTDVPHLGLLITMRGTEKPVKVKWTRPFLKPLHPLSSSAALQTFLDIADDAHEEDSVKQVLEFTGNLPLAVSLIANVASSEGCDGAISRWMSESTQMLSDGYDKWSSLEISIMLSLTSPRMTKDAQELLSILSMLPDGLTDADLVLIQLHANILGSKMALIQTALAFVDSNQRTKVLAPIREYIIRSQHPTTALKLKLQQYFHGILGVWDKFRHMNPAEIFPQISQNLGNLNSVLQDALSTECINVVQNVQSILHLNAFYASTRSMYSPLLLDLFPKLANLRDNPIFGDYLIEYFSCSEHLPLANTETKITMGNEYFLFKQPLQQAKWYQALGQYFHWAQAQPNLLSALQCYQRALSLLDNIGHPETVEHAQKAQEYAEILGNVYGQAYALWLQAKWQTRLVNYARAQILIQNGRELLKSCCRKGGPLDINLMNEEAEIHLLKTQYLESRRLQASITSTPQLGPSHTILASLNIASIDTATGMDSEIVGQNLSACQLQIKKLHGYEQTFMGLIADIESSKLHIRDGNHVIGNALLVQSFVSSQAVAVDLAIVCLESLADLSSGMNNVETTTRWAGIFLALALKSKEMLTLMQAFRCMGQLFAAQADDETSLSVFNVALDGFTFMDIHRWRADCMVRIADILNTQGEVMKAIELWKAARPLFERSSQTKDIIRIDANLATVDFSVLAASEKQLQQLKKLHVPIGELDRVHITEEGTDGLAVEDQRMHEVWD